MSSWEEARRAFADAGAWFVGTVPSVGDRWDEPALGEWDIRALVGHASRSFLTVESYLQQPATAVEVASAVDYYRATRSIAAGPEVAERGREAGRRLGEDPVSSVRAIAARVLAVVEEIDGTELVTTVAGGMRMSEYLPTRTFELVVHTLDLGRALGTALEPPARPARQILDLISELVVSDGQAAALILAATGRGGLPADFSVL